MAHAANVTPFPQPKAPAAGDEPAKARGPIEFDPSSFPQNRPVPYTTRMGFASADSLDVIRRHVVDPFYELMSTAIEACVPLAKRSVVVTQQAGRRLKQLKDERPLELVALIAGSAFALGMVVRLWRSKDE